MTKLFLLLATTVSLTSSAQQKGTSIQDRFYGEWRWDESAIKSFSIFKKTSTLLFGEYQLCVNCNNVYKHDTLLLYAFRTDASYGIPDWLRPDGLFAKCYISANVMHVNYIDPEYRNKKCKIKPPHKLTKTSAIPYHELEFKGYQNQ